MNTVRYAKWMSESGWKVKVFCVEDSAIHRQAQIDQLSIVLVHRNRKYFDFHNARRVKALFQQYHVRLVWFRDTRDFDLLGWVKRFSTDKFSLLYQQAMQFGLSKKDFFHTMRFKSVDAWVSTLPFLARQVMEQTRFPHSKIHVVPLGVDAQKIRAGIGSMENARQRLQLPLDAVFFGVIGRLDPLKGQHIAIEALKKLKAQKMDIHLLLMGETTLHEGDSYGQSLHNQVIQAGLNDRVHFRPYSIDVQMFYNAIDVFALCSKGETFGTVTIEAMAFAKPIVATNSSGSPEILEQGKSGILFKPDDANDLAEALKKMFSSKETRQQYANAALESFRSNYSREISVSRMEKIISDLLRNSAN
jgi:D-inositol-3-phosphate glycosyltransferase